MRKRGSGVILSVAFIKTLFSVDKFLCRLKPNTYRGCNYDSISSNAVANDNTPVDTWQEQAEKTSKKTSADEKIRRVISWEVHFTLVSQNMPSN